jgi:protein-tyrosine phosphatase
MFTTCPNFRDLGGKTTSDGRLFGTGQVYRSGTLTHLVDADHDVIDTLGIRTICDLRQQRERDHEPTHWRDQNVTMLNWDYKSLTQQLLHDLGGPGATQEIARQGMESFYRKLPFALSMAIRDIFTTLAEGGTPLLFHCAAGKDRTGVVAGLLLAVLGVPREVILADYARTAELIDYEAVLRSDPSVHLGLGDDGFSVRMLEKDVRMVLLSSEPRFLNATFEHIANTAASIEDFLAHEIGVDPATFPAVREHLLS